VLAPGDWIAVKTPGGGGYGPAEERDPAMVEGDIAAATTPLTKPSGYLAAPRRRNSAFGDE